LVSTGGQHISATGQWVSSVGHWVSTAGHRVGSVVGEVVTAFWAVKTPFDCRIPARVAFSVVAYSPSSALAWSTLQAAATVIHKQRHNHRILPGMLHLL
jgi:hypothetical protein